MFSRDQTLDLMHRILEEEAQTLMRAGFRRDELILIHIEGEPVERTQIMPDLVLPPKPRPEMVWPQDMIDQEFD